jgi:hypothetical protein
VDGPAEVNLNAWRWNEAKESNPRSTDLRILSCRPFPPLSQGPAQVTKVLTTADAGRDSGNDAGKATGPHAGALACLQKQRT